MTALVSHVPGLSWLSRPLVLLSTLAHESGHGLTAILVGGRFLSLTLWPDGSGVAPWIGPPSALPRAVVAAGGLVGPACAAALGFYLSQRLAWARPTLGVASGLLAVGLVLVVRGGFAWLYVASLAAALAAAARWARPTLARFVLVFLSVQLAASVFTRADYLFTPVAHTGQGTFPSDVAMIAEALWLPYWFWGALCGAFSLIVLLVGVRVFWRRAP